RLDARCCDVPQSRLRTACNNNQYMNERLKEILPQAISRSSSQIAQTREGVMEAFSSLVGVVAACCSVVEFLQNVGQQWQHATDGLMFCLQAIGQLLTVFQEGGHVAVQSIVAVTGRQLVY